jgi:FlaA1/EpsC-like NDP-sugar epimerase
MEARHRSKVLGLRPLRIEDLLRRPRANSDVDALRGMIRGDVVVVTGAGGTIGGELCRQILAYGPALLVLVDRSEVQLFEIEQELRDGGAQATVSLHVGDVGDVGEMKAMFKRHRPGIVFHAAAHKHVSFMERQPCEAIRNNVVATALLARAASEAGVGRFVLVSTDKANDPTSVMGASKRIAEMFVQGLHEAHVSPTRFMAVRFGNVLGSSGSVVQVFRRQIAVGGPVTVTHPDATRYFLTIPEAGDLLLQACAIGNGGDVLVLDMGEPVKIMDLAREMVELSGRRVGEDIAIQFTGLRPGEKMFEDASHDRDKLRATTHPRIFRWASDPPSLESMDRFLEGLVPLLRDGDDAEIWRRVQSLLAKCGT